MHEKVSIIVPIYNVEDLLVRCLDSIVKQTYKNLEILLIDDGSTDNSSQICNDFLIKDSRISYFKKVNGGLSDARNYGFDRCSGKYTLFIDSDDYIELESVERLMYEMSRYNLDIVCANALKEDREIKSKMINLTQKKEEVISGEDHWAFMLRNRQYSPTVWKNLYSTDFLKKSGVKFVKGLLHEDVNWMPKVLLTAKRVKFIDYCFYHYIIRKGSITTTAMNTSRRISDATWIYQDLEEYLLANKDKICSINIGVFKNYLANIYIYSVSLDETYLQKVSLDKKFLFRNSKKVSTYIKAVILTINPKIFVKIKCLKNNKLKIFEKGISVEENAL